MDLNDAITKSLDGEAVLFTGAGFSLGATNLRGERFLRGSELASSLAARAGLPTVTSLDDAADAFLEKYGVDALIRELQQEFTVQKLAPFHRDIATVPWKRVYSTNYDNILETAYSLQSRKLVPVTLDRDIYRLSKTQTVCVHLNGFIDKLDRETLGSQLKLTESSYLTASIAESSWAMLFRQDIRLARAVFFVGYSLYDLDVKRLLVESPDLVTKCFFILGENPDAATVRRASRFGTPLAISVEELARRIGQQRQTHEPFDRENASFLSVKEHAPTSGPTQLLDKDFLDLLQLGVRTDELVSESLHNEKTYYLERSLVEELFHHIDTGERVIVVASDLGNGKSLFLDGVRLKAFERGFRVFEVRERTEESAAELERVAKIPARVLVTIEEYPSWLDEIRLFRMNATDQAVLILTARNFVHDLVVDDLLNVAGLDDVQEIRLDNLADDEIAWFVEAFDEYGLWGHFAARSREQKIRYLKHDCDRQIHAILLSLFESPDIGKRLRDLSDLLRNQRGPYEVLLGIFVLTVLNQMPTIDTLLDVWGADLIGSSKFRRNEVVQQFVNFDRYEILVRSPVAAQYLLKRIADPNLIVATLIKIANTAHSAAGLSDRYRILFTTLMRFSGIQLILPEQGKAGAIITYYESVKNLARNKSHPLFWLQYAIACLVIDDLPRAKRYFDTSYSLSSKTGFDTRQIDNHFARFLLKQAIETLDFKSAMESFRAARNIINRQMRDERLHYPYRVAIQYQDFLEKFGRKLSPEELFEIGSAARTVLDRISELPVERGKHRHVRECKSSMEYIMARTKSGEKNELTNT